MVLVLSPSLKNPQTSPPSGSLFPILRSPVCGVACLPTLQGIVTASQRHAFSGLRALHKLCATVSEHYSLAT